MNEYYSVIGWQVAADANTAGDMYPDIYLINILQYTKQHKQSKIFRYPDQSLYPANSGPELARRINRALRRADQIECVEAEDYLSTVSEIYLNV